MRRYTIGVNGKTYNLVVDELDADTFDVRVGDQRLAVQLVDDVDLPQASITPDMGRALQAVKPVATPPPPSAPTQSGAAVPPAAVPRPTVTNTAVAGPSALGAPMPGAIAAIEVAAGARVKRGDVLLSLDAMKMINAIRAPRDAVVAEVMVKVGQTVAFGDPLMRFEG
jgi:biotin carboxyl carrier protein